MMITIWQDKMIALGIRDTGALLESLKMNVFFEANGDISKIAFVFLAYGRMVDMGVGRGMAAGITKKHGDVYWDKRDYKGQIDGFSRKKRPWYNSPWYRSVKVLTEKRILMYGQEFRAIIYETLKS